MNYDNPAARLLTLIKNGKSIPNNGKCRSAWEKLLEVQGNNPLLMSRLGKAMELPEAAILSLKEHFPSQQKSWMYWESQVNNAFMSQNLNGQWATFIDLIDEHSVNYLQMSADLLQTKANTKQILGDEVSAINEKLNKILEDLLSSSLEDDIKKFAVRNIRKIIVSLEEYKLTGALPILDSVDSAIGHARLNPAYYNFLRDTELGARICEALSATANIVTVAVGLPQLSTAIALLGQ